LSHREILGEGIASADRRMRHSWLTPCIFDSNCFYNETIPDLSCQAESRANADRSADASQGEIEPA